MDFDIEAMAKGGEGGFHDIQTGVMREVKEPVEVGFRRVEAAGEFGFGQVSGLPGPVEFEFSGGQGGELNGAKSGAAMLSRTRDWGSGGDLVFEEENEGVEGHGAGVLLVVALGYDSGKVEKGDGESAVLLLLVGLESSRVANHGWHRQRVV